VRFNILIFLLFPIISQAQANPMPSEQDIKAAKASYKQKMEHFNASKVSVPSFPNMPILMSKTIQNHTVLNDLFENASNSKSYQKITQKALIKSSSSLIIFTSFSMPNASLKRLIQQAQKAGGTVLMRGLVMSKEKDSKPSFRETRLKISTLKLRENEGFAVDPTIFEEYHIEKVPAFVIQHSGMDVVYGDVSLDYALHYMETHWPKNESIIQPYLNKLKHQGFFK